MKVTVHRLNRYRATAQCLLGSLSVLMTLSAHAAKEPQLADFAEGSELNIAEDRPVIELPLPDGVYTTVTHWDLADLRVFDAQGVIVPHAFCPAPNANGSLRTQALPLYTLATTDSTASDAPLTFTTADGTQLQVVAAHNDPLDSGTSFIVDARNVEQPLHALQLDWITPDRATETHVRVLASQDLNEWRPIVANAKLLHAKSGYAASTANATAQLSPQQLEQQRVALPAARYQYLRVEPVTADAKFVIIRADAEYLLPAPPPEPTWFSAGAPHADEADNALIYESDHRVPVSYLRVLPSAANNRMLVTVQSRAQHSAPWQTQWSGEVYSTRSATEERTTAPIKIAATSSPYWRLLFNDANALSNSAPKFDLGYLPLRLHFLAQGMAPYTLAYGSNRAISASAIPCESLFAGLNSSDKQDLVGHATLGAVKTLAGIAVLRNDHELPLRQMVLWGLLILGVIIVATATWTRLKRKRRTQEW